MTTIGASRIEDLTLRQREALGTRRSGTARYGGFVWTIEPATRLHSEKGGHPTFNRTGGQHRALVRLDRDKERNYSYSTPMSPYHLTIERKSSYLHATVTGENSRENVARYLMEVLQACHAHDCFRVLMEERLEGPRLAIFDIFAVASEGSEQSGGVMEAVAYVDINAAGDLMEFAETVARNRGMPIRVFRSVAEAEQWLVAGESKAGAAQPPLGPPL